MKRLRRWIVAVGCSAISAGCSSPPPPRAAEPPPPPSGPDDAPDRFPALLAELRDRDETQKWDEASCKRMTEAFSSVKGIDSEARASSLYNAAVAALRCGHTAEARVALTRSIAADPKGRARALLILVDVDAGRTVDIDRAIAELETAVHESSFRDTQALVGLARLQMRRNQPKGQAGCRDDFECARLNLQRALAVGAPAAPVLNQLALHYLTKARATTPTSADPFQFEIARLVAEQAREADEHFAPAHNTLGVLRLQVGDRSEALAEFKTAVSIEPRLTEAWANLAVLELGLGDYAAAERAYRKVVQLDPKRYQGHLGLAVTLRDEIATNTGHPSKTEVMTELAKCKELDANRPEAYFYEGIYLADVPQPGETPDQIRERLKRATFNFEEFLRLAKNVATTSQTTAAETLAQRYWRDARRRLDELQ